MSATYRPHTATGRALRELLARVCGTNGPEVDKALRIDYGQRWLAKLARDGSITRALDADNLKGAAGKPMAQYFLRAEDAAAWLALPVKRRPNLAMRQPAVHIKVATSRAGAAKAAAWHKAGLGPIQRRGAPVTQTMASVGISSGVDARYSLTAEERAELLQTGPLLAEWRRLRGAA